MLIENRQNKERLAKLREFIRSNPEARELKRAIAVKMVLEGKVYLEISRLLEVSPSSISRWKQGYISKGVEGLKLDDRKVNKFLSNQHREEVISWLAAKDYWNVEDLIRYVRDKYGVTYKTRQRYYDLIKAAKISWKRRQKLNP